MEEGGEEEAATGACSGGGDRICWNFKEKKNGNWKNVTSERREYHLLNALL